MALKVQRHAQKKEGAYFEGHHIIPKSKGGTGTSTRGLNHPNIVLLTAREHFLAHWLLWRIYRDRSSALAFHKMLSTNNHQTRTKTSRGYEEARLAFSETNKGNQYGKGKSKVITLEQKQRHSEFMKGRYAGDKNPFYGKVHSKETKEKLRAKALLRPSETAGGYKGIKQVLLNGVVVAEFKSSKEVAEYIGCSHSNVRHVLGGTQTAAKGFNIIYKLLV
jgi:hypothetical protein